MMRPLLILLALASCTPVAATAQTRPTISGCGTVAIARADRTRPDRIRATATCFERAAEIATAAAAERRALLIPVVPVVTPPTPPVTSPPPSASTLDPSTLLALWQPRFAALGFRLEVGPGAPFPTLAKPGEWRWPVGMYAAGETWPLLYYAVFAPAGGDAEALTTATGLVEGYFVQASHYAAGRLP